MRKKGFTLIELLVVVSIIAMLLAILMPALNKVKKIAMRVVCGTNLKGLGTAQTVYAQDYDDEYTVQGKGNTGFTWAVGTDGFQNPTLNWANVQNITVGASLYLLVREADVTPKSFVCPSSDEKEYDGTNTNTTANPDLVELWDFGNEAFAAGSGYPKDHVSYSFHQPYGSNGGASTYAADGTRSAAFAIMADKSPYFDPKIVGLGGTVDNWESYVNRVGAYYALNSTISKSDWQVRAANSATHNREGQNVLFCDGHVSYENAPDVSTQNDGIYVIRGGVGTAEDMIRGGAHGSMANPEYNLTFQPGMTAGQAAGNDSYLVNDDDRTP